MLVDEVMTREVKTLHPDQTISEAVTELAANGISGAPVVDDNELLVGIITENDILNALKKAQGNKTRAAKLLNISRDTLRYKMKKFAISSKKESANSE